MLNLCDLLATIAGWRERAQIHNPASTYIVVEIDVVQGQRHVADGPGSGWIEGSVSARGAGVIGDDGGSDAAVMVRDSRQGRKLRHEFGDVGHRAQGGQ